MKALKIGLKLLKALLTILVILVLIIVIVQKVSGNKVRICYMCSDAAARKTSTKLVSIRDQAIRSARVLGLSKDDLIFGEFDNIKMNVVPHLDLVKFIESAIKDYKPNIVITHFLK